MIELTPGGVSECQFVLGTRSSRGEVSGGVEAEQEALEKLE